MKDQMISMRQLMTLLLLGLFTLGADLLPSLSGAGAALWLAPLLCLPILLLGLSIAFAGQKVKARKDLGEGLLQLCGGLCGRLLCFLFLLWGFVLLTVNVARCTARLGTAEGSPILFVVLVLALAVWMVHGKLSAAARSCEIFYLIVGLSIVAVILLAFPRLQFGNVLLLSRAELARLPGSMLSLFGIVSMGLYVLFFGGSVTVREKDKTACFRRISLLLVSLSALLLLILGCFGAPLVAKLERPFFQMVAALGVEGAFQRLEALYSALWMLGDLALFVLLLFALKRLTACVIGKKETTWSAGVLSVAALACGVFLVGQEGMLRMVEQIWMPRGGLLAGAILLLFFFLVKRKELVSGNRADEKDSKENEKRC